MVREWVDGESMRELISEEGPLDPARATSIAHSIADALAMPRSQMVPSASIAH